jgi:hypothetical protein
MTMALPCRAIIEAGQKDIDIIGPVAEIDKLVIEASDEYWRPLRGSQQA